MQTGVISGDETAKTASENIPGPGEERNRGRDGSLDTQLKPNRRGPTRWRAGFSTRYEADDHWAFPADLRMIGGQTERWVDGCSLLPSLLYL